MKPRRPLAGSHPEENYVPATRKRMFLDRPTSHGGWPEGEYDPPVADRLYSWYKKMKMMPESESDAQADEYIEQRGNPMRITESMLRKIIKEEYDAITMGAVPPNQSAIDIIRNNRLQFQKIADELFKIGVVGYDAILAQVEYAVPNVIPGQEDALKRLARKVADLQPKEPAVTDVVKESALRRVIREEYGMMKEVTKDAIDLCKSFRAKKFKTEEEMQAAKKTLATDLSNAGAAGEEAIAAALEGAGYGDGAVSFAAELAKMQTMKEGQRGNDENGQHDNDTDPSDPYAKKLKESRRLAIRHAVVAELRRRGLV